MATHSAQICTNFCPVPLGPNVKVLVTSHPSAFARAMLSSKSNVTSWFIYTRAAVSPPPRGHCPWPSEWTMSFHSCLCLPRSALCDSIKKSSPPQTLREREKEGGGSLCGSSHTEHFHILWHTVTERENRPNFKSWRKPQCCCASASSQQKLGSVTLCLW